LRVTIAVKENAVQLLIYWVISAISLIVSALVARGVFGSDVIVDTKNPLRLMLGVAVLGLVNATIGRFAKLVTLPLNCLTLGLVWLLINAGLFYWVGGMKLGFHVGDFWAALVGSMLMGIVLGVLQRLTKERDEEAA
jgi:putative membrane protein